MLVVLIVVMYLVCSFLGYGSILGGFTEEFSAANHLVVAIFAAVIGPFGLPWWFVFGSFKNFRLKPLSREERYKEFDKLYGPLLTRKYFEEYF